MEEIPGKYFLMNGNLMPVSEFSSMAKELTIDAYEVIRLIEGIPLFCEDHFLRIKASLELQQKSFRIDSHEFNRQLNALVEVNNREEGNVKVVVGDDPQNLIMHFIPHSYPSDNDYQHGVHAGLYVAERVNPHIKTPLIELKQAVNNYIQQTGLYEVFYVDRGGFITEGSRSNVFFIKDKTVYTCQAEKVLLGITRQKVLECIKIIGIHVEENAVSTNDLSQFSSAFMTGTSPKVLPLSKIDSFRFETKNYLLQSIMNQYNGMINRYIKGKK